MKAKSSRALSVIGLSAVSALALTTASFAQAQSTTGSMGQTTTGAAGANQQQITTAESAAPGSISSAAAIAINENGKLQMIRQGTNGWTCLTSFPESSSAQASGGMAGKPICVDRNGLDWIQAWIDHKDPPANRISAAYMLQGVSASQTDPFVATAGQQATRGQQQAMNLIQVGPHVMVLGAKGLREGLSASVQGGGKSTIDASMPFVMWAGTPYEHLMIPVGATTSMSQQHQMDHQMMNR